VVLKQTTNRRRSKKNLEGKKEFIVCWDHYYKHSTKAITGPEIGDEKSISKVFEKRRGDVLPDILTTPDRINLETLILVIGTSLIDLERKVLSIKKNYKSI